MKENDMKPRKTFILLEVLIIALVSAIPLTSTASEESPAGQLQITKEANSGQKVRSVTLQESIEIALNKNRTRPMSQFAVEISEAQLQQALSSYWPQAALRSSYSYMNKRPDFLFPASTVNTPASTVIANTPLGPLPINVPAQSTNVPQQDVKLLDKTTLMTTLNVTYPLYTGGQRSAVVKQARSGLEAAKQEARRTDLQVIYDVKRMYYGAVLARELYRIGSEALQRMDVTLELTEKLYKTGSGRVKKTDYLRNKSVVEGLRSAVSYLKANEDITLAALTNTMGLDWDTQVQVSESDIPFNPYRGNLAALVSNAYSFNPDWAKMQEGLNAAEAHIDEAKSGYFPKVAFIGNLENIQNAYDMGIVTPNNKNSWNVGIALELPLFSGFRTKGEIREAVARLGQLSDEKVLLREGIALQIKYIFTLMISAQEQQRSAGEAAKAAEENRDLNERAYQEDLVETKDVIEAQLVESFLRAQYQKTLYDHIETQAHLDYVVGKEVQTLLWGKDKE